jgi:hypothetical protein
MIDAVAAPDAGEDRILFGLAVWWDQNSDGLSDQFRRSITKDSFGAAMARLMTPSKFFAMIASSEDSTNRGQIRSCNLRVAEFVRTLWFLEIHRHPYDFPESEPLQLRGPAISLSVTPHLCATATRALSLVG